MLKLNKGKTYQSSISGDQIKLFSPTLLPKATGYLWNKQLLLQMNCRGFATAQFMQPEPARYSYAPNIEQTTFIQPEMNYFSHYPGRFFYLKDNDTGEFFSAPYEPVRTPLDYFEFSVQKSQIRWSIRHLEVEITITLSLPKSDVLEIWKIEITNRSHKDRNLSFYPYFTVGYMSWMNQSATYIDQQCAIVATSIRPYQKVEDYSNQKDFKDKTFLMSEKRPDFFCANQSKFEGEGNLNRPSEILKDSLSNSIAQYETPAAVMQFNLQLQSGEIFDNKFLFGAMKLDSELETFKERFFGSSEKLIAVHNEYKNYLSQARPCITISTPDPCFDQFVNHWLPHQIFYHGDINRLTNDPQTRNFLQDNMGMSYLRPSVAKKAFRIVLEQQLESGALPDGILLHSDATLKYINQVPHADHNVWLPICISAYLDETNDFNFLDEGLGYASGDKIESVVEHIDRAMNWLIIKRDHRLLSLIEQGDWCDPMNMVGHKGTGVSAWLSMATVYALQLWSGICEQIGRTEKADYFRSIGETMNQSINSNFWDGRWYARGITDEGRMFGTSLDKEGRIFLNTQSWSMLCGGANEEKIGFMLREIESQLQTPFGPMMLAPSYTCMQEDIGRLTQKSEGVAENGSVYNHASVFFAYALYQHGHTQTAFKTLKTMIPSSTDIEQRGQLPNFIPNYYRGAYYQHPDQAGRSSHLFNTGTVSWYYRCLIDGLFGLRGRNGKLEIKPNIPQEWERASVKRIFMGAELEVNYYQSNEILQTEIYVDGEKQISNILEGLHKGQTYLIDVYFPRVSELRDKND